MSVKARFIASFIALIAAALVCGASAIAQTEQELRWCQGADGATPDQQIAGCTAFVRSGKYKGPALAIAVNPRGYAYTRKMDFDQSIKLNPNSAEAFYNRSLAKQKTGDNAGAEADMAAAKKINPNVADTK